MDPTVEKESIATIREAIDAGVTLLNTGDRARVVPINVRRTLSPATFRSLRRTNMARALPTPSAGKNDAQPISMTSENVQRPMVAPIARWSTTAPASTSGRRIRGPRSAHRTKAPRTP